MKKKLKSGLCFNQYGFRTEAIILFVLDLIDILMICSKPRQKSEKDINNEISAVIRQITASVTFLPLLEGACKSS